MPRSNWPELSLDRDHETLTILHLAAQMLGKLRVAHSPWTNHGWHAALQPRADGFETLPTAASDDRTFSLTLDLCEHCIALSVSSGVRDRVPLAAPTICDLHSSLVAMLDRHHLPSTFDGKPNEIDGATPFTDDRLRRHYEPESAVRLRDAFAAIVPEFERLRAGFSGKSSPVQMWWGAFDLAVSRYSGRTAPPHPGGMPGLPDRITREAYSHEVTSGGFWAAGAAEAEPFFYSYIYPEPEGYRTARLPFGHFDESFGEFVLPYADVRGADEPEEMLQAFLESAYSAAADCAGWDRAALEREPITP